MKNIYIYKSNQDSYYEKYLENLEASYGIINSEKAIYLEYFFDNLLCIITISLAIFVESLFWIFIIALVLYIVITYICNTLRWKYVVVNKENIHQRWTKSEKITMCLAFLSLAVVLFINNYYNQPREFLTIANPPIKIETTDRPKIYYISPTTDESSEASIDIKEYEKIIKNLSKNKYKLKINSDNQELDSLELYNMVLYNSEGYQIFSFTVRGDSYLSAYDEKGLCRTYEVLEEKLDIEFMKALIENSL